MDQSNMALPQIKPAKPPTTILSLPLELRQTILLQSYKHKRTDQDHEYIEMTLLFENSHSVREIRGARFFYYRAQRRRRHDQGQERDLEYYRMDKWADNLIAAHASLSEDMVFVQKKWRAAFEKEMRETSKWWKGLGRRLKDRQKEFELRDR